MTTISSKANREKIEILKELERTIKSFKTCPVCLHLFKDPTKNQSKVYCCKECSDEARRRRAKKRFFTKEIRRSKNIQNI